MSLTPSEKSMKERRIERVVKDFYSRFNTASFTWNGSSELGYEAAMKTRVQVGRFLRESPKALLSARSKSLKE